MRLSIALLFACATLLVTTACGADESQPQSTPTAEAAGPTAAPSATPAAGQLSDLALLYLDASRGPATDLYSAAYDGTAARKVASLPGGARVLDVRGRTAAVALNLLLL